MICPYCRTPIDPDPQTQKVCEGCATPHHIECFAENGGCTLFGCKFAPPDEPKVQVGTMDVARAVAPISPFAVAGPQRTFTGFGDVQTPMFMPSLAAPPPVVASTPPPPPPLVAGGSSAAAVAVAPALEPVAPAPAPEPQRFITPGGIFDAAPDASGAMVANQHPKNRLVYILLGLALGVLGAHNFYAGYRKVGAIQLCITLTTLFYAAPITAIWALVEVCTVDRDSQMVEFD